MGRSGSPRRWLVTVWGYARVRKVDRDAEAQLPALADAGIRDAHIVTDRGPNTRGDRPGLTRLLQQLEPGDVFTVWRLDRLGRSVTHLMHTIAQIGERGAQFRSLSERVDTGSLRSGLLMDFIGAVAAFERDLARERSRAAQETARRVGRPVGRPTRVTEEMHLHIRAAHVAGQTQSAIARDLGLAAATVGRVIRGEIASLTGQNGGDAGRY